MAALGPLGVSSSPMKLRPKAGWTPRSGKKSAVTAPDTNLFRRSSPHEAHVAASVGRDARQRLASGFGFNERGAADFGGGAARPVHAQLRQLVGLGIGQRSEQDGVDHAEDGGVRPDAQSEGQHRHGRKAGVLPQLAQGETKIVHRTLWLMVTLPAWIRSLERAMSRLTGTPSGMDVQRPSFTFTCVFSIVTFAKGPVITAWSASETTVYGPWILAEMACPAASVETSGERSHPVSEARSSARANVASVGKVDFMADIVGMWGWEKS
jgi:hypothetical protein